jgi:ankyrin repeat protein
MIEEEDEGNQFQAAEEGDLASLKHLLTRDNVNERDGVHMAALHWAAENGHVSCVRWCLEMGADVNARDKDGWTPLFMASLCSKVDVVRVLLDAGANPDRATNFGHTPLHRAITDDRINVAQLLIDRGAKVSNVQLGEYVRAIPDWVTAFVASRLNCRSVAVIVIGIHKYHRTHVTGNNDINVLRLIGKHVWSLRMEDVWVMTSNQRDDGQACV